MRWIEVSVFFDSENNEWVADWIANIFYDCDLKGVVIEEPVDEPSEGWGKGAIKHEHSAVIGYFPKSESSKENFRKIKKRLGRLEQEKDVLCRTVYSEIDEKDWAESWKDYFWPQKIGANIVVKPAWREYFQQEDEIVIEIDPGMAFGTGTHPTTGLCIIMIDKYMKSKDSFLDVGTGSGILMIAAAKLGARKVYGTDNDQTAVDITRENWVKNKVSKTDFKVINCHLVDEVTERFDVVTANLSKKAVLILLNDAIRVLTDDGVLICSGVTEEDRDLIVEKMIGAGFDIIEILTNEDWVAIAGRFN